MPTVQAGARGTIGVLEDRVVREMMATIADLEPDRTPLTSLLNATEKVEPTINAEPQWMENELVPHKDITTATVTPASTTVPVAHPEYFLQHDLCHVPGTGENFQVLSIAGGDLTVKRSIGSVAAAQMVQDEPVWIIGGAQREGDTSRTSINTLEVQHQANCQIVRNSFDVVGTLNATELYDGNALEYEARRKLIEHSRQLEHIFLFGQGDKFNSSGQNLRTSTGLFERIQTNRYVAKGILTEAEMDSFCRVGFRYGSPRKLLLAAPRVVQAITNFGKNRLETRDGEESYGVITYTYKSPFGLVDIANSWTLEGEIYGGSALLLDVDKIVIRPLRAVDTSTKYNGVLYAKRVEHIQPNDSDTRKDEWFSEVTLQTIQEKCHSILEGVQG